MNKLYGMWLVLQFGIFMYGVAIMNYYYILLSVCLVVISLMGVRWDKRKKIFKLNLMGCEKE